MYFLKKRSGFTLVELSIVLVILGLLVGGVLAGQSLIRAAELRAVTREFTHYETALSAFRDKYFALPGDMPNAVRYWGAQAGGTADGSDSTCAVLSTAATGAATCNGNGDGLIWNYMSGNGSYAYEVFRAWQHLANAGLVEGSFTGITAPGTYANAVLGSNTPRSKLANAGWTFLGPDKAVSHVYMYDGQYGNILIFGASIAGDLAFAAAIPTAEAYNIDMKMDDGRPITGKVRTPNPTVLPNCATSNEYALNYAGTACSLLFLTGY